MIKHAIHIQTPMHNICIIKCNKSTGIIFSWYQTAWNQNLLSLIFIIIEINGTVLEKNLVKCFNIMRTNTVLFHMVTPIHIQLWWTYNIKQQPKGQVILKLFSSSLFYFSFLLFSFIYLLLLLICFYCSFELVSFLYLFYLLLFFHSLLLFSVFICCC